MGSTSFATVVIVTLTIGNAGVGGSEELLCCPHTVGSLKCLCSKWASKKLETNMEFGVFSLLGLPMGKSHELPWVPMGTHGHPCPCPWVLMHAHVFAHGSPWVPMGRCPWGLMGANGSPWPSWVTMGSHVHGRGSPWEPTSRGMGTHGLPCHGPCP